jgi:hypothetical protein
MLLSTQPAFAVLTVDSDEVFEELIVGVFKAVFGIEVCVSHYAYVGSSGALCVRDARDKKVAGMASSEGLIVKSGRN